MKKYKNNEAIYQILSLIDHHFELGTNPDFINDSTLKKLKISEKRINLIIASLLKKGYIEGTPIMSSSVPELSKQVGVIYPYLTIEGMNYLVDNSSMKKAFEKLKLVADVIPL